MDSAEHEALCRRCGMSCHFAVPVNGLAVVIDALRCKFLGRAEDGRYHCTVYEDRFDRAPWCHSAQSALSEGFLAQDCPYARGTAGYRGKVRLSASLQNMVLPAIRAELLRVGAPIGVDPKLVAHFLSEAGGTYRFVQSPDGSRYLFSRDAQPSDELIGVDGVDGVDAAEEQDRAVVRASSLRVL